MRGCPTRARGSPPPAGVHAQKHNACGWQDKGEQRALWCREACGRSKQGPGGGGGAEVSVQVATFEGTRDRAQGRAQGSGSGRRGADGACQKFGMLVQVRWAWAASPGSAGAAAAQRQQQQLCNNSSAGAQGRGTF